MLRLVSGFYVSPGNLGIRVDKVAQIAGKVQLLD